MFKGMSNFQMVCIILSIPSNTILGMAFFLAFFADFMKMNPMCFVYLGGFFICMMNLVAIFAQMENSDK